MQRLNFLRKFFHFLILSFAAFFIISEKPLHAEHSELKLIQKISKAIVHIKAESGGIFNAGQDAILDRNTGRILVLTDLVGVKQDKYGCGIIVSKRGLIVTNFHTVKDAGRLTVILQDGKEVPATLTHSVPEKDFAVLRIDPPGPLTAIQFADSNQVRKGARVYLVGHSPQVKNSVGGGEVVGMDEKQNAEADPDGTLNIIQIVTGFELTEGDSGSAILDQKGKLLGMVAAGHLFSKNPIYAIPSNIIKNRFLEFLKTASKQPAVNGS